MQHFFAGSPVGHPPVEWIQDRIAALRLVELRCVFDSRIVDDGCLAALFNLKKNFSDKCALASARVSHDQNVALLHGERKPESRYVTKQFLRECSFCQIEAEAIGVIPTVELARRHEFWPPQPSPMFLLTRTNGILGESRQQAETEDPQASPQCRQEKIYEGLVSINPMAQECVKLRVVVSHLPEHKPLVSHFHGLIGERKRLLAVRSCYRHHLFVERQSRAFSVRYVQRQITISS